MEFEWITPQQASDLWGVSARRVQALCINRQIKGIQKIRARLDYTKRYTKTTGRQNTEGTQAR